MPDIWTKHPEIVRSLVTEAGFRCGVEGRFLKGRDPAWTCIFDGQSIRGDLYIHHIDQFRSEIRPSEMPYVPAALLGSPSEWSALAVGLIIGFFLSAGRRRRRHRP